MGFEHQSTGSNTQDFEPTRARIRRDSPETRGEFSCLIREGAARPSRIGSGPSRENSGQDVTSTKHEFLAFTQFFKSRSSPTQFEFSKRRASIISSPRNGSALSS